MIREFNWLDIIFVILLLGMIYKGSRMGVGSQVPSLFGWFVLLFVSIGYYDLFTDSLFGFLLREWARPVSFVVISALVYGIVKLLERVFTISAGEELSTIEKIGGAIVGGMRACILYGLIGITLLLIPLHFTRDSVVDGSKTGMTFVKTDSVIYSWISGVLGIEKKSTDDLLNEFINSTEEIA